MSKHLKTRIIDGLASSIATFVQLPPSASPHTKGVRYFTLCCAFDWISGAMDTVKQGQKYRKRIVVRPSRHRPGLHELYTYHFPKHWSDACVANRELMSIARQRAHALEHDHSREGLEWRIRCIANYYNPEPGLKPYARLFHYAYAVIQRELRSSLSQPDASSLSYSLPAESRPTLGIYAEFHLDPAPVPVTPEDVSFLPIIHSYSMMPHARHHSPLKKTTHFQSESFISFNNLSVILPLGL